MRIDVAEASLGVVAIGRNEGERLRRCLESARAQCRSIVYVDSGSTDESVAMARNLGVEVVELDLSTPFTAARARNEGLARLREIHPGLEFVQFVDGDCELVRGWIQNALRTISERPEIAVVCGRRRERHPDATIYNLLCDLEWDTPVGEVEACGGDSLARTAALERVGGFDARLIAGEEPDLCLRLRKLGYSIRRIDAEMTLHDAAMTRLGQWWRRMMRGGYAAAESRSRNGAATPESDRRCLRGVAVWVLAFPLVVSAGVAGALAFGSTRWAGLALVLAAAILLAQTLRIAAGVRDRAWARGSALLYAAGCMAAKVPQGFGMLRYLEVRSRRRAPRLIEYK